MRGIAAQTLKYALKTGLGENRKRLAGKPQTLKEIRKVKFINVASFLGM